MIKGIVFSFFLWCLAGSVIAQTGAKSAIIQSVAVSETVKSLKQDNADLKGIVADMKANAALRTQEIQELILQQQRPSQAVTAAQENYNEQYFVHQSKMLDVVYEIFVWQESVSYWIAVVVLGMVVSGVVFSGVQLVMAMRAKTPPGNIELEASMKNLRLTTSVTGVAVLVISLAFFYLFIHDVYTLKPMDKMITSEAPLTRR